eukprot:9897055-Alexandrium_andersonii.AAC.1
MPGQCPQTGCMKRACRRLCFARSQAGFSSVVSAHQPVPPPAGRPLGCVSPLPWHCARRPLG